MTHRPSDCTNLAIYYLMFGLLVNIAHGLRFTAEPEDQIVALASPLWWDCVTTDLDPISYRWSFNDNSLPAHENVIVFGNGTLHIRKISADDVGVYSCIAETPGGQILKSREVTLQLAYIDPSFTLQPQAQTVLLGDNVTLVCKIGSLPPANITWLLNGEVVILGTATQGIDGESTLVLSPIIYYGSGEYKCRGTNSLLQVYRYSLGAELVVRGTPVFLASLQPVSVPEGFKASFHCFFHGNPEPSLTWFVHTTLDDGQVSTSELLNNNKFNINPNGTLTIYNVTDEDEAFYTCSVSNIFGQMSESAVLNVTGAATLPEFTLRPQNVSVHSGGDVTLQCGASGNPVPEIVWLQNENVLLTSDGIVVDRDQLTITDVQAVQSGWYTCMAENNIGSVNSSVYINVQVIPSIFLSPLNVISVLGDQFVLNCQAVGNPIPSIVWSTPQYGDVDWTTSLPSLTVYSNGTLVVSSATYRDDGVYTCTARNVVGYKQMSATVKVESPPEFTLLPISQSVNQGGTVYFHCQSTGVPTPTFSWSKDGEGIITSTFQRQIYLNHTLVLRTVNQSDAGVYRCTASNRHSSILAVATLTVTVPPHFVVIPENQTVHLGSRVDLQCDSTGEPVPIQSWRKDGRYLFTEDNIFVTADGSQVSIDAITENQFGEYTCVSSNLAGTRSVSAWIKQYDVPVITIYPQNTTINQSETLTLQCKGETRTGTPSVVWYRDISGEINQIEPNDRVTVSGDGDLRIQNVEPGDEGWYRCALSNSAGTVSTQLFVNVYELPRILHTNSPQTSAHQSSVILTCQSTGDPPPTLEWIHPSGNKVTASSTYLIGSDSLEIVSANQNDDNGDWTCKSCNIVGCVEGIISLQVVGLPFIDSFQAYKTGTSIKLECKVKGQPLPGMTFTSKGQTVTRDMQGHSVQTNVLTVQQAYVRTEYTCRVANKYGFDSVSLTAPGQISAPSVGTLGSNWVTLQWTQSDGVSDLPLTNFQVQMTSNGGRTWQNVPVEDGLLSKSTNVSRLLPYKEYNFRVAAGNLLGDGKFSEMSAVVRTLADDFLKRGKDHKSVADDIDTPSPPTNLAAIQIDEGTVLFSWSPSQFMNGDRVDVAYLYTVTVDNSNSFYRSETVFYNGTLQAEVTDLMSSGVYVFTVKAVNLKIGKSSDPVSFTLDLTVPSSRTQTQTSSPSKIIIILAGVLGGIILICIIIFIALRIRRRNKTESLSFIKPRLSLDQFYMENSKELYRSESRLSMKRSRSGNSFYSFTNDDSFHGNGLSVKDSNGFSPNKRKSDGDVLLVAKNPLYTDTAMSVSTQSSRVTSPEPLLFDNPEQSYSLHEIELPSSEVVSTGSRPNSLNCGKTGSQSTANGKNNKKKPLTPLSAENLEDDINDIYNSMKPSDKQGTDQSLEHIYASIHSDGQSSRSKDFSVSSNNSLSSNPNRPKPPIRVLSPDKLRASPPEGDTVDMATKRSSRSISPKRSRSTSPMLINQPKPPTRVLGVDKLRISPEADIYFVEEANEDSPELIGNATDDKTHATEDIENVGNKESDSDAENNKPVIPTLEESSVDKTSDMNEETVADVTDELSNNKSVEQEPVDNVNIFVPESEGAGEFLLGVKETRRDPWRSKMEDNFLTDEQIKEELISAELY